MRVREALDRMEKADMTRYQDNPNGFIKNQLGIILTKDICRMAESVRNTRDIAISYIKPESRFIAFFIVSG